MVRLYHFRPCVYTADESVQVVNSRHKAPLCFETWAAKSESERTIDIVCSGAASLTSPGENIFEKAGEGTHLADLFEHQGSILHLC
jgi:hypothetical protein